MVAVYFAGRIRQTVTMRAKTAALTPNITRQRRRKMASHLRSSKCRQDWRPCSRCAVPLGYRHGHLRLQARCQSQRDAVVRETGAEVGADGRRVQPAVAELPDQPAVHHVGGAQFEFRTLVGPRKVYVVVLLVPIWPNNSRLRSNS